VFEKNIITEGGIGNQDIESKENTKKYSQEQEVEETRNILKKNSVVFEKNIVIGELMKNQNIELKETKNEIIKNNHNVINNLNTSENIYLVNEEIILNNKEINNKNNEQNIKSYGEVYKLIKYPNPKIQKVNDTINIQNNDSKHVEKMNNDGVSLEELMTQDHSADEQIVIPIEKNKNKKEFEKKYC